MRRAALAFGLLLIAATASAQSPAERELLDRQAERYATASSPWSLVSSSCNATGIRSADQRCDNSV